MTHSPQMKNFFKFPVSVDYVSEKIKLKNVMFYSKWVEFTFRKNALKTH